MDDMEKMVWAAAFAQALPSRQRAAVEHRYSRRFDQPDLPMNWAREESIRRADAAVMQLREYQKEHVDRWYLGGLDNEQKAE